MQPVLHTLQIALAEYSKFHAVADDSYGYMKYYITGNTPADAKKCEESVKHIHSIVTLLSNASLSLEDSTNTEETWNKINEVYASLQSGLNAAKTFVATIIPHARRTLSYNTNPNTLHDINVHITKIQESERDLVASEKQTRASITPMVQTLTTGPTQENFSKWISSNRTATNFWVLAGIEEFLKNSRGNRRHKFVEIVESQKDAALGSDKMPITPHDEGVHSMVARYGLQFTMSMPLSDALKFIDAEYREDGLEKNLRRVVAATSRGVAFVDVSGGGTPIDFKLVNIIGSSANPPTPTTGISPEVIQFYNTVNVLPKNKEVFPRENIILRGTSNEWYFLETMDGELYRWGLLHGSPIIPATQINGVVRWRSARATKYAELCSERILNTITSSRIKLILGNFADYAVQDTSAASVSEAVEDGVYHAIVNEINTIRPSTYEVARNIVRDEELIETTIVSALVKVVGDTKNMSAETSLPRLQRYNSTIAKFLQVYAETWRKENYDGSQYTDGSAENRRMFLGVVKAVVTKTVTSMSKNNFWDIYLASLKDFVFSNM